MNKPTYLIVDDERPNRILLKALLEGHADQLQFLAEADGGKAAVEKIDGLKPDIVFLDIHMPDMDGFEVLKQVVHQPHVVFVTAYDQYALKAFEENTIDYLVKPVDEKRLSKTVQKLVKMKETSGPDFSLENLKPLLQHLGGKPACLETIAVKTGQKIILVPVREIAFFEAKDKYVALHTADGREHLTDHTLTALEPQLPPPFLRVQKGCIINTQFILEIHKHLNNRLLIKLTDKRQSEVLSGTSYIQIIRDKLGL